MNKQQKRNQLVLQRLIGMSNEDEDGALCIATELEFMLDELASEDFFGTERQSDPRGDQRDYKTVYTMFHVDGIDE